MLINGERSFFDGQMINPNYETLNDYISSIQTTNNIILNSSIEYNITLGETLTNKKLKYMKQLMNDMLLSKYTNKTHWSIEKCSTGERQRIQLIRIILQDRPIWILDEALSNIDSRCSNICLTILQNIQREKGKTVFYVSHVETDVHKVDGYIRVFKNKNKLTDIDVEYIE